MMDFDEIRALISYAVPEVGDGLRVGEAGATITNPYDPCASVAHCLNRS